MHTPDPCLRLLSLYEPSCTFCNSVQNLTLPVTVQNLTLPATIQNLTLHVTVQSLTLHVTVQSLTLLNSYMKRAIHSSAAQKDALPSMQSFLYALSSKCYGLY